MAIVRPFRAHRPPPALAPRVASPPYDVINTKEARALAEGNPHSFLHVSRPEIDLPQGTDEHANDVYAQGQTNLQRLVNNGTLLQDPSPRFYVYAQKMPAFADRGPHAQVGLVACTAVSDYVADTIKKHEKTRADKEDDRTRHIDILGAHDEPVFLTYRAVAAIDALVADATKEVPVYDFATADGVGHTFWTVDASLCSRIEQLFGNVPALYVADGHHRSAAAARVHALRGQGAGEHDVFLAVLFPHDQMQILAYNRLVRDPNGRSPEALLEALRARFDVSEASTAAPEAPKSFGAYLAGHWYRLGVKPGTYQESDPVARLDASLCQDQILAPLFGITDPRRDTNVDFVGGIRGAKELERRVAEEGWSLALHLYQTGIEDLMAVSDAGLLMPPKSTWFEPKLRSGLFLHAF
ncbi:MAG: DUF1015 family protein [Myxococcales bacterium]